MDVLGPSRRSGSGGWRCRYATATALRAVLLYRSHRSGRCCFTTVIASSGAAMHSHRFVRCCSATVTALRAVPLYHCIASSGAGSAIPQSSLRAVLLCHSHSCASRCAAIPLHRIERCCYAQSSLRAVLLCHRHCASRCAAIPQSSLRAVLGLLCHSHRFVRCWFCYATVIASCGAGSLSPW